MKISLCCYILLVVLAEGVDCIVDDSKKGHRKGVWVTAGVVPEGEKERQRN